MPTRKSPSVLADRIAANVTHHEPGWRLPRHSALARRFSVSTTEIDAALEELVDRHLIRLLPDGQLYRASPADYFIRLAGVHGPNSHIDPMGAVITCRSFRLSCRRAPEKIARALDIGSEPVCVARLTWTANAQPAALALSYLTNPPPGLTMGEQPTSSVTALTGLPLAPAGPGEQDERAGGAGPLAVHAVSVEMLPPPPSAARTLQLSAGAPATLITTRFDDTTTGTPAALAMVALHPELFRIVLE
jgi:hypothetical protein